MIAISSQKQSERSGPKNYSERERSGDRAGLSKKERSGSGAGDRQREWSGERKSKKLVERGAALILARSRSAHMLWAEQAL
jgi:hypothetical protein